MPPFLCFHRTKIMKHVAFLLLARCKYKVNLEIIKVNLENFSRKILYYAYWAEDQAVNVG